MFKSFAIACIGFAVLSATTCTFAEIAIIPKPQQMQAGEGSYQLTAQTGIDVPNDARAREIASFLRDAIREQTSIHLADGPHAHGIELAIDPTLQNVEAYRLSVTPRGVIIQASTDRGLFWGVQTLRQLLPLEHGSPATIPAVQIEDAPTFAYRGFMLDVGRHFYPVSFIKKQLDMLSYYKINTFHWHLTDDQGWRLQIKQYPKLTDVGAWRTEEDGTRYGGFYTQAQIRDVVEYARQRNIMIIPEIEMPGHSLAALASYPELSCTKQPLTVATTWGVFKDIDCVGDKTTFTFLQNVLDEVIALFPSTYIHIGGDETPKDRWKDCASCQALMKEQGLQDEEGLQSYFIRHMQAYLASKGKTLVGWDEILEGGADKDAIVEIWRGDDEAHKALANGNRIIVAGPFYLDAPLDRLTVKNVYSTDITGGNSDAFLQSHRAQILGAEAPLWSERANPLNAEWKIYPRILALAENLWTGGAHDAADFADFQHRLQGQYGWLDAQHIAYGPEDKPLVSYTMTLDAQQNDWQLKAVRGFAGLENHYTLDGLDPTAQSPSFDDTLTIKKAGVVKVTPFLHGVPYNKASSFTLADNLALGKPITFSNPVAPQYGAGDVLVDGIMGSDEFYDGRWAAWHDADFRATIDLQQVTTFHAIDVDFLMRPNSRILLPKEVYFFVSMDGQNWTPLYTNTPTPDFSSQLRIQPIGFMSPQPVTARYVRVNAERSQSAPASFSGGAKNTWLFIDEIRIH
jgi:hexosaminidase